jgi:hypothetical protein
MHEAKVFPEDEMMARRTVPPTVLDPTFCEARGATLRTGQPARHTNETAVTGGPRARTRHDEREKERGGSGGRTWNLKKMYELPDGPLARVRHAEEVTQPDSLQPHSPRGVKWRSHSLAFPKALQKRGGERRCASMRAAVLHAVGGGGLSIVRKYDACSWTVLTPSRGALLRADTRKRHTLSLLANVFMQACVRASATLLSHYDGS